MDTTLIDKIIAEDPELVKKIDAEVEARIKETYKKIKKIQKEIETDTEEEE